ncbi:MAG: leucine-rich repeat protein, partial [Aeriscardovia sp.]|nr:leucine-rich repeat protein [Aeriscardovia sp.]
TKELYENSIGSMTFSIIEEIGNPAVAFVQREKDILITEFLIEDKDNAQFGFGLSSAVSDTINGFYSVPITVKKWDKTYIISSIGKNAFTNCTYIDSIYVPKTITKIGKSFINCSALRSFAIGNRNPTSIRLDENCFEDIYNAVLYVPAGTKERYEALEPWNKFSQIIESSPISAGDISARFGSKADLPIYLKNTETVEGLQFKLTLPDGVSVVEQDGNLLASTTERTEGMTIMGRKDPDEENSYLFVVFSLDGDAISGTEGAILNVRLDIAHDMELGVHDIKVEDVYMTTSTFETLNPAESTSELTIKDFMQGDVNNDGIVNVTDAIGIVNHVLKNTPETFIEGAADVNQDRIVNVTDAIGIINMILNK